MCNISERGFWLEADGSGHGTDWLLADALVRFFAGKTVVDLGCGMGDYVAHLQANNICCEGYDGNPHTEQVAQRPLWSSGPIPAGLARTNVRLGFVS